MTDPDLPDPYQPAPRDRRPAGGPAGRTGRAAAGEGPTADRPWNWGAGRDRRDAGRNRWGGGRRRGDAARDRRGEGRGESGRGEHRGDSGPGGWLRSLRDGRAKSPFAGRGFRAGSQAGALLGGVLQGRGSRGRRAAGVPASPLGTVRAAGQRWSKRETPGAFAERGQDGRPQWRPGASGGPDGRGAGWVQRGAEQRGGAGLGRRDGAEPGSAGTGRRGGVGLHGRNGAGLGSGGVGLRSREGTRLGPGGPGGPGIGYRVPGRLGGNGAGGGWDGTGRRPRRKGSWWRHWSWKKAVTVAAASVGLFLMLMAAAVAYVYSKTPIPDVQQAALQAASTVYFSGGKTVVGTFGSINRQMLTYNQIPAVVREAVVAAEDKNFYHEGGISTTGILRAAYYDLTSSGGSLQGGSTITQQLVRNYYEGIGTAQTFTRKIKEIFVAEKLARVESKAWILTQYLNTVYFGAGTYGIGAAAQTYFGVPVSRLTVAQAAMLAAMIQSPGYYSPNPKDGTPYQALVYRWHYVLNTMVAVGTLPARVAAQQKFPAVIKPVNNSWGGYRGYIMQAVQWELEHTYHYSLQQINNGGLHVVTTFSQRLMNALYASVRYNENLMRHSSPPTPPYTPHVASTGLPPYVRVGALLEQPGTGAILAMYSGANYSKTQYDNALQSRNQVGSSFKPYVLATAVKQGMSVQKTHLNGFSPLWIPPDTQPMTYARTSKPASPGGWYQVTNDEVSNPNRPVSVVEATALSLNTAYADLWHRVALVNGQHEVVDMARAFGVDTRTSGLSTIMQDQAGTALGQGSLTVEEQATMIATLADHGVYSTPHVIQEITTTSPTGTASVTQARIVRREVLTPDQAAAVDYALSFDMGPLGTANGLGMPNGQTVIAKTGTTNLSQSAFFLGASPQYAMAVGMFVNHPGCTLPKSEQYLCTSTSALAFAPPKGLETLFGVGGLSGYGGQWPALIWHTFFTREFSKLPVQAWPPLPANYGQPWNLVGKLPPRKHHHKAHREPPVPGCQGNGRGHKCRGGPSPSPTLPPTPAPTATPTPTSTCPPGLRPCRTPSPTPTRQQGGGAVGGPLALAVVAAAAPMLPLARRLRVRRRPRPDR